MVKFGGGGKMPTPSIADRDFVPVAVVIGTLYQWLW